jgi:AAA+ ATPase superfamily predicted ATPase
MRARDFFPLGLAAGCAFCNRTDETKLLIDNIKNGKHTLLIATRRYGKSSLALHAIKSSKLPFVEADFYMANNEKVIESYILAGVVELIGKALGPLEKLMALIKKYVKNLHPKINVGAANFKLELFAESESDSATNVKEALWLLEKLLENKKKHAVFLMDEFQNVGVIAQGKGIEAAIRHVAQKTKYLTIIFSGSNRKLLQSMFEDENRPLYKLCWKLALQRISKEHYVKHIQLAAKGFWKQNLSDEAVNDIISFSERHPFYLNKLCDRLWAYYEKKPPSVDEVAKVWNQIIEEEKSDAVKEISLLSAGQKNVILQIARNPTLPLTSKQSMMELKMTSSSIMTALEGLEEKDMIEKESDRYQIINPVVRYYVLAGRRA